MKVKINSINNFHLIAETDAEKVLLQEWRSKPVTCEGSYLSSSMENEASPSIRLIFNFINP